MITKEKSSPSASLFCGDCLELMKDISNGSVDLILCDPLNFETLRKMIRIIYSRITSSLSRLTRLL